MSRALRRWTAMMVVPLGLLLAAPSCGPALKTLASKTGKSAEELGPIIDDTARGHRQKSEDLAEDIADSLTASAIVELAKDPGVEAACHYIGGRMTKSDIRASPGAVDWVTQMVEAQMRNEPVEQACTVAGKIAGSI